jgi:hypothetical protein
VGAGKGVVTVTAWLAGRRVWQPDFTLPALPPGRQFGRRTPASSREALLAVRDARHPGRHRAWRVVAIGAVAAILATGTAACRSPRGQPGAGGTGRALAVELAADYTATWQQHRSRFSFVDDSASNPTGYNGVADLASDAADFSATPDGVEIRLIRDKEYTKGALAGMADRWLITPRSMPDARSALPRILPMPQGLARSLASSAASIHLIGAVTDDGVATTSYQWTMPLSDVAGLHFPPGASATIEIDIDAAHLVRRIHFQVAEPTTSAAPASGPRAPSGTATLTLSDFDAVPAITTPPDPLTIAQLQAGN